MNKLLQYMIGAGNVSDKYLPHLVKYQSRGEVKKSPLLDMSTLRPVYDNIPSPEKMLESYKPLDELKALSKAYQIAQREIDALTIADRKARINASLKARKQPFSAKQLADETQAIGDKLRLFPNDPNSFIDDYLNPAVFIGNLASNLGRLPLNIQEGDYIDAAMAVVEPLAIGAYEAIGSPLIKKMFNKAAPNVKFQAQRGLRRIVPGYVNKKMAAIDKGNQWTKDWYSNPIIKERYDNWVEKGYNYITPKEAAFQKQLIETEPNLVGSLNLDKSYANRLSGTIARDNYDKLLEQGFFTKGTTNRSSAFDANTTLARYAHGPNDALVDVLHPEFRAGSKNIANTTVHENIHAITKGDHGLTRNARTALTKPFAKAEDNFDKYLRKPTEVHARIGELRRQFRLTPEQHVDLNTMNRIMDLGLKGKTSVDQRWFELVKDKSSLRWLFNNAPAVVAPVAGVAMLDQKKGGGVSDSFSPLVQAPKTKKQDGGIQKSALLDTSRVRPVYDNVPNPMTMRRKAMDSVHVDNNAALKAIRQKQGELKPATSQGAVSKVLSVLANPVSAASYVVKGQRIPDYFDKADTKYYDAALGVLNPFNAYKDVDYSVQDAVRGDYGSALLNLASGVSSIPSMPAWARKANPDLYDINKRLIKNKDYGTLAAVNTLAAADAVAPLVVRTPGLRDLYKKAAYNIASTSNGIPKLDPIEALKNMVNPGRIKEKYTGDGTWNNYSKRDLVRQYIYGDSPDFEEIDLKPFGLQKYYDRYGNMKVFKLHSQTPHGETIVGDDFNSFRYKIKNAAKNNDLVKEKGYVTLPVDANSGSNPVRPIDNVAGHMVRLSNTETPGRYMLTSQDIWKFHPDDYAKKWGATSFDDDVPNDYMTYLQAKLLERAGKPFILMQENPFIWSSKYEDINNAKKFKKGGVFVSSRGQYDYPGYDTLVPTPTGQITMQGVPYPVYGEDETGYGQMMYPGGEYQFPGRMVYEKPMMQHGGQKKSYNPRLAAKDVQFQNWYRKNTLEGKRGIPYSDQLDYDYFSFFKNGDYRDPSFNIENHFPDTYKRPGHYTFSNESIYSTPENPGGYWEGENYFHNGKFKYQDGGPAPLYVSDSKDTRLKNYEDSLYNYNLGRRMMAVLDADKNLLKVRPGSDYDKALQAKVKAAGNKFIDNSEIDAGGYKNYEKIGSIMKEYQRRGNKAILPIRYQGYFPDPDNGVVDMVTLRSVWDALGVTDPRPPGAANLPEWKKPERQVVYKPAAPVPPAPRKTGKKPSGANTLFVNDPNDPRLKAYQDSLRVSSKHSDLDSPSFVPGNSDWVNFVRRANNIPADQKIDPIGIHADSDGIPVYKYPRRPVVYKRDPPQLATVEQRRAATSMGQPILPQLSPSAFTQNNMSKSRAVDFWNPSMSGGVQGGWHRRLFDSMEEADNFMKFIRENNLSQGYEVTNSGVNNDADRVSYAEGGENEEDPKTLMKKKLVGKVSTPIAKVNLRPVFKNFKTTVENLYDPSCPDGVGCSRQATKFAQKITGLPWASYAPADATFRDAVAERSGLKNLFDQTGDLRRNADSHQPNWKYPTKADFDKWKAGDIVSLDAGVDVFNYSPPPGYTWDDASQVSHNGVVVGFTEEGRPIIKHGYATGRFKGKSYTEVLGPDNRVKDLGHGRYAIKSVWRPKEIDDAGNINRVAYVAEPGEQRAARKQSTSANYSYFLNPTEEEKMVREQPVAAQTSGAANRLQTKQSLINMFNNEQLDKELQYKLGMTAEEVDRMKPVIFGVVGQESRFNDIDNPAASLKEVIGSVLGRGSRGAAQIKLSSLTKDERKVLGINRSKDLEKEEVAYKAAMLLLNNARKRMNQEVAEGTHPELVDKDEYFRSGYYYNAPARAINSAKSWGDRPAPVQIFNPLTWANRFTSRRRPRPFGSENPDYDTQNELRMDKGSYPWKLMQQAKDLGVRVDFDKGQDLEEVVIRGARPGSTFERFSKGGQHGGLDRWFAEKWVDVKTGKDCGRQEGEKRGYPACRPSKRVSSETPKTSSEMSSAEKAKFKRTKTSSERIPYNHKRK